MCNNMAAVRFFSSSRNEGTDSSVSFCAIPTGYTTVVVDVVHCLRQAYIRYAHDVSEVGTTSFFRQLNVVILADLLLTLFARLERTVGIEPAILSCRAYWISSTGPLLDYVRCQ
jgi:hypothetical protein